MAGDPANKLLARLDGVRKIGADRWTAKSPLRPKQRTGSLSIRRLADGRVLLHDFAGATIEEIVRALGVELSDLFPERIDVHHRDGPSRERRPFTVGEAVRALRFEMNVVWFLLGDVESGAQIDDKMRSRAGLARRRCQALIHELADYG